MRLIEIVDLIYNTSNQVSFGANDVWPDNVFTKQWFLDKNQLIPNALGLYWILTDSELIDIECPLSLPTKGCNFSINAKNNLKTFSPSMLPSPDSDNLKVIYNGHEQNVMNRVRMHFSLSQENKYTGALGIKHYKLSSKCWTLKYFTINDINKIGTDSIIQKEILNLLNSKTGRIALENAWRTKNGWPILCKK